VLLIWVGCAGGVEEVEPPPAPIVEDCTNGLDDDGDGLDDCQDRDCPECPEDCTNGVDDDRDGRADCDDPGDCPCVEICGTGLDEDQDGLVDCEDADCAALDVCVELDCQDGADSDADGLTDCQDDDCWYRSGCLVAQVTGGGLLNWRADYYTGPSSGATHTSADLSATGVTGTLALDRGTETLSCAWGVDAVRWDQVLTPGTSGSTFVRSGFQTSGACGGVDSAVVLPQRLTFEWGEPGLRAGDALWYTGQVVSSHVQPREQDFQLQLSSGEPWTASGQ
jgi:hypothetical protein